MFVKNAVVLWFVNFLDTKDKYQRYYNVDHSLVPTLIFGDGLHRALKNSG